MHQIFSILIAILIFGAIIFVHELGHFLAARLFKVTVREFSIGMGPGLISYTSKKSNTVYSLRALPIGGFVSMAGEDEESEDPNAFSKKAAWKRFIIVAAGAFMNLLAGILLTVVLVSFITPVSNVVSGFYSGYEVSSYDSGLRTGDQILSVNGTPVSIGYETRYLIAHDGYRPVEVVVLRGGQKLSLMVSFPTEEEGGMLFGIPDIALATEERSFLSTVRHAWSYSTLTVRMIWDGLIDLITGKVPAAALSGPVGVTGEISSAAQSGNNLVLLNLAIIICMNIGIFNLLPIPALDGGRLLFILWEIITRKPIPQKYEAWIHAVGILLLLGLMVVITFKDIAALFG